MVYTSSKTEDMVLGAILNDTGCYGLMRSSATSLRKELFTSRRHAFVFGIAERMFRDGLLSYTPKDILEYAESNGIRYGDTVNFCCFMCDVAADNFEPYRFREHLKELVGAYIRRRKHNGR